MIASKHPPKAATTNPHLQSRLLASEMIQLKYPEEEELKPLLCSLLERHNLHLSEASMAYILKHSPRDPLSFESIFARINEISLISSRPANQRTVREAMKEEKF